MQGYTCEQMKKIKFLLSLLVSFTVLAYMTPLSVKAQNTDSTELYIEANYNQSEARRMLGMINDWRTGDDAWIWDEKNENKIYYNTSSNNTLQPLAYDYALEQIAMQRAAEIALNYDHIRPDGTICFTAEYEGVNSYGENIAIGTYGNAEVYFEQWQETNELYGGQGHRRNMLNQGFNAIGIGYAEVNGVKCWVQEFGMYKSNIPEIPVYDGLRHVPVVIADMYHPESIVKSLNQKIDVEIGKTVDIPAVKLGIETDVSIGWFGPDGIPITVVPDLSADSDIITISNGKITGLKVGVTTFSANVYGCTINYTINVLACSEHTWDDGQVTKEPSCSEQGIMTYTCTACGTTKTEFIPKTEHTIVVDEAKAPTCTTSGLTEGSHCSVCKEVIKKQEIVPATGHEYEVINRVESEFPCGGDLVTYKCKYCEDSFKQTEGSGHIWENEYTIDKEPTCTEPGSKSKHCIYECSEVTDVVEIDSLGHSFTNYVSDNNATCASDGTKTAKCDRCDETDTIVDKGSMLSHHGGEATCTKRAICEGCGQEYGEVNPNNHVKTQLINQKEATCTEEGYTGDTICNECKEIVVEGMVIEATGHDYKIVNRVESELPCGGEIVTYTCNNCNDTYTETINGKHLWSDDYSVDRPATCTEDGFKSRHCLYDGCTAVTDRITIEKLGHDFVNYTSNNDATCEHDGTMTGKCSRCDETDTIVDEGSKLPHQGGVATCTTPAVCEKCGNQYGEVDPNNHIKTQLINQKEATCTENGYTGDTVCTGCNEVLKKGTVIESAGHQYKDGICTVCGAKKPSTVIPIDPNNLTDSDKTENSQNVTNTDIKKADSVATGDDSELVAYGMLAIAMLGCICLAIRNIKKEY